MYSLDKFNFELLIQCLKISHKDSVNNILIAKFGKDFNSIEFETICREKIYFSKDALISAKRKIP